MEGQAVTFIIRDLQKGCRLFFLPCPVLILFRTIPALVVFVTLPAFRAIVLLVILPSIPCISVFCYPSFRSLLWCRLLLFLLFPAVVFFVIVRSVPCVTYCFLLLNKVKEKRYHRRQLEKFAYDIFRPKWAIVK